MAQPIALVTGASSGIGEALARRIARDGRHVVLVARRTDRLETLARELERQQGVKAHVIARDLVQPGAVPALLDEIDRRGLAVDWLVNNAGFGTNGRFVDLPLAKEREEILLNVYCLVALSRLYLPAMVARARGTIVNLGSVGSFVPTPYMATYSATKAFVLSFSEALATELASTGVGVLALCPGATKTEFQEVAGVSEKVPESTYMTAEAVVTQAIEAAKTGRRTLVPGWMNKTLVVTTRMTPRSVLARIAGSMFAPKAA